MAPKKITLDTIFEKLKEDFQRIKESKEALELSDPKASEIAYFKAQMDYIQGKIFLLSMGRF